MTVILRGEGHESVDEADEAVAFQRGHRLRVELGERPRRLGDRTQGGRPPLAEGALEPRLLAQRLVAAPAARAGLGQRALAAARDAREADRRAEIHQRLAAGGPEGVAGAL